jgi:hypothetical protein
MNNYKELALLGLSFSLTILFVLVLAYILFGVLPNNWQDIHEKNIRIDKEEFYFECEKVRGGKVLMSPNNRLYCTKQGEVKVG